MLKSSDLSSDSNFGSLINPKKQTVYRFIIVINQQNEKFFKFTLMIEHRSLKFKNVIERVFGELTRILRKT